ncbi:MAG: hypothetical protein AAF518_17950 [Spirochaetota bacterium]
MYNKKNSFLTLLFLAIVSLQSCATGFDKRKRIYRSEHISLYKLQREDIPGRKWLKKNFTHPPKSLTKETLSKVLASLEYKNKSDFNVIHEEIFPKQHIDSIIDDLDTALHKLKTSEVLVVITKHDEVKSVLSNSSRTTFYIWQQSDSLNIVFGQIKEDLDRDDAKDAHDWAYIPSISLNLKRQEKDIIVPAEFFAFKKINSFPNRNWLQIDLGKVSSYNPVKTKANSPAEEEVISPEEKEVEKELADDPANDDDADADLFDDEP